MLHANVAEGVHRIEDAYTNWYLIEDGDRLTVVDAGVPKSWDSLHDALRTLGRTDRKSTRLNSSHANISYAVFCLKKKKKSLNSQIPFFTSLSSLNNLCSSAPRHVSILPKYITSTSKI